MQLIGGSKRFPGRHGRDDRWVFTNLELSVEPGEVLALMGPSGSGKSTLLRVLAGLDELTGGTLHRPERVGLVFQDPLLLPWRNVAANIALGLSFRANAEVAAEADVEAVAEELGIGHLLNARVDAISGGEAQRVALARAVLTHPELLLLDEPFAALDPPTRVSLQGWFRNLVHERGIATVFVTHDLDEALRVGDRVALLGSGPGNVNGTWKVPAAEDVAGRVAVKEEVLRRFADPTAEVSLAVDDSDRDPSDGTMKAAVPDVPSSTFGGITRRGLIQGAAATGIVVAAGGFTINRLTTSTAGRALRVGYLPITDAAPLLVASALGYYREEQVEVDDPVLFRGWDAITEGFQGNHLDVAHLLMPTAVQLRFLHNQPVKIVAWNHMNGSALTVGNHIQSIGELGGTTVAIPFWYSVHNVALQMMLAEAGLEVVPSGKPGPNQVALTVMAPSDMVPGLAAGSISGYIVAEPFNAMAEAKGIGKINRFTGDVWRNHACCVVVMHERVLATRPEEAHKFVRALARAQLVCQHDHGKAITTLTSGDRPFLPQPVEAVRRTFDDYSETAYGPTGAIKHPDWDIGRIDFQPFPFASYTEELVRRLRHTVLDPMPTFLDGIDPADAHAQLVDDRFARSAIHSLGGPERFGLPADLRRTETIEV
ncbi:MAG: ABC transporter substrate-binding protein [Aquihabitans sp.]